MSTTLTRDFVEQRLTRLQSVPDEWNKSTGIYYELNLKMCQIRSISWGFTWGDERKPLPKAASLVEQPSKVLKIDLSLNDLIQLNQNDIGMFKNLQYLDSSLNRIKEITGLWELKHLCVLNLSHNFITDIKQVGELKFLLELNLSMNSLESISDIPQMPSLTVLNLNGNKLKSLSGIQSLPRLRELAVQQNQLTSLIELSSNFHLTMLDAADNQIQSLNTTADILRHLSHLEVLTLYGNPIAAHNHYQNTILDSTSIISLDNISVRPIHKTHRPSTSDHMTGLKQSAQVAFEEQIKSKKQQTEDEVAFLQKRILAIQDDFYVYEKKMKRNMDSCLSYLESLNVEGNSSAYNNHSLRDTIRSPLPKPWDKGEIKGPGHSDHSTDEILRLASTKLAREHANTN